MVLERQRTLAIKVESAPGVAETLTTADVVVQAIEPTPSISPPELERLIQAADLDRFPSIIGARTMSLTFGIELRGSGTAGTPPGWFRCMQACGYLMTDETNNVNLDPESNNDNTDTATIATIVGDDTHALWVEMKGARGNPVLTAGVNQIPRIDFTFQGVISQVQNASPPAENYESTLPLPWRGAQITIGGTVFTTGNYGNFTFDAGNEVVVQEDANDTDGVTYATINNRNPRGTIDPRVVDLTTYDPITDMLNSTTREFSIRFGSVAGNIITLTAPAFQVLPPSDFADRQGHLTHQINYMFCRSSGDDSHQFVHT